MLSWGIIRYRTIINPLTAYACVHVGGFLLISSIVALYTTEMNEDALVALTKVNWCGLTVALGFAAALSATRPIALSVQKAMISLFCPSSERCFTQRKPFSGILLWTLAALFFVLMAIPGGGGLMWFTDPRSAYLCYQSGVVYCML